MPRELIAITLMVSICCIAGRFIVVNPLAEEVHALETEVDELNAALSEGAVDADELDALAEELNTELLDISHRASFSTDSRRIYGAIKNLTGRFNLSVTGIDVQVDGPSEDGEGPLATNTTVFAVAVEGPYTQVAKFLNAMDQLEAFTRISALSIKPVAKDANGEIQVQAKILVEALGFQLRQLSREEE